MTLTDMEKEIFALNYLTFLIEEQKREKCYRLDEKPPLTEFTPDVVDETMHWFNLIVKEAFESMEELEKFMSGWSYYYSKLNELRNQNKQLEKEKNGLEK